MEIETWVIADGLNTTLVCYPADMITSKGIWLHNEPLKFAMPLFILQISLIIAITHIVRFLLKPLKLPNVVTQILGGILVGPLVLGRSKTFNDIVYPPRGSNLMTTMEVVGMMYYVFILGVKNDPTMILTSGRKAWIIAVLGFILPHIVVTSIYTYSGNLISAEIRRGPFLPSLSMSLSITTFPTALSILAELNLLNSEISRLAMPVAMISDIGGWVLLIVFHFFETAGGSLWMGIAYIACSSALVAFTIWVTRPAMKWIIRQAPEGKPVAQGYIVMILLGNMVYAFICDLIGGSVIDGALLFGLMLPDGPPLGAALVEKSESFIVGTFFPLFFTKIGSRMNAIDIDNWNKWGIWHLMIVVGHLMKIVGTMGPCLYYKMPFREALSLGLIMIFRGEFELIFYTILSYRKIIDTDMFTELIIWTMMVTAIAATLLRVLYQPLRSSTTFAAKKIIANIQPNTELRVLTCIHSHENVPSIINLLEALCASKEIFFCVYVLHLMELIGRFAPKLIAYEKKNESEDLTSSNHIINAFKYCEKRNRGWVSIQPFTMMSPYKTMHEEICRLVLEKSVSLIIVPYHNTVSGGISCVDHGLRIVNSNILAKAPCPVGVLVDLGLGGNSCALLTCNIHHIAVFFLGGPDDREALIYASSMANHPRVNLTVLRILSHDESRGDEKERELDDELVNIFNSKNANEKHIEYREVTVNDGEETIRAIRSIGDTYNLLIVGRRRKGTNSLLIEGLTDWNERPELGVIGDLISSFDFRGVEYVLVIQEAEVEEAMVHNVSSPLAHNLGFR